MSFDVEPATTGIVTASATARQRSRFSGSERVGDSPVVPVTTKPSLPCSASHLARVTAPSRSSAPSASNGVAIAVRTAPKRPGPLMSAGYRHPPRKARPITTDMQRCRGASPRGTAGAGDRRHRRVDSRPAGHGIRAVRRGAGGPARTNLIGRRSEITEVAKLVTDNRPVTIVGPGGTGKSRLAVEVATELLADLPDGARWVDRAAASRSSSLTECSERSPWQLGISTQPPNTPRGCTRWLGTSATRLRTSHPPRVPSASPSAARTWTSCPRWPTGCNGSSTKGSTHRGSSSPMESPASPSPQQTTSRKRNGNSVSPSTLRHPTSPGNSRPT